jgi:hypothetical protein
MARGWESKSVEAQQEARETAGARKAPALSPAELAHARHREALTLALARAERERALATQPAHRRMLDAAVAALRQQLHAD